MVKKLRRLSTGALMSLDDDVLPVTRPVTSECELESECESETEEEVSKADKKKEERKAKKKEKMKLKKQQKQSEPQTVNGLVIGEPSTSVLATAEPEPVQMTTIKRANAEKIQCLESKRQKTEIRQTLGLKSPAQPRGLFPCPTNDKDQPDLQCQNPKIPFCRLYNHLRSFHSDRLLVTEAIVDTKNLVARCNFEIPVPVVDYRHVIKVKEFGLFVLVFSAKREMFGEECAPNKVTGFVKMVGTVSAAKHFTYKLEVAIGKYVANCSDMCHHSFTEEETILLSDQCLTLKASKLSRFARIKLELLKNTGNRTRTPLTTNVQIIPNFGSTNHQGESSNQRKQQHKKKKNKKH